MDSPTNSANDDTDTIDDSEDDVLSDAGSLSSDNGLEISPLDDSSMTSCPLFSGSLVDANQFEVTLMSLIQKHNLTYSCQDGIIKMLSVILPSPSKIPSSSYILRGKFVNLHEQCMVYYLCSHCFIPLSSSTTRCNSAGCVTLPQQSPSQYIHISFSRQLKDRYQGTCMCCIGVYFCTAFIFKSLF